MNHGEPCAGEWNIAARFSVDAGFDDDRQDGETVEMFSRKSAAFREASAIRRRFRWVEVFDRMARNRKVQRWDYTSGQAVPVESRFVPPSTSPR